MEYMPAVGAGVDEASMSCILGGFPVLGVKATVFDGSYHEVDASEMAFHIAGSMAFKDAMNKGGAILLEPIMKVEVTMPEDTWAMLSGILNPAVEVSKGRVTSGAERRVRLMFRWLRRLVIPQIFVPELRDVVTTPCSLRSMSQFQSLFRKRFLLKRRANN